jgi:hypothetical protein
MDVEIVKKSICDAIPQNVNISKVDIKEGNAKLMVEVTWEVLKAAEKVTNNFAPSIFDGYCRPIGINSLYQELPINNLKSVLDQQSTYYRDEYAKQFCDLKNQLFNTKDFTTTKIVDEATKIVDEASQNIIDKTINSLPEKYRDKLRSDLDIELKLGNEYRKIKEVLSREKLIDSNLAREEALLETVGESCELYIDEKYIDTILVRFGQENDGFVNGWTTHAVFSGNVLFDEKRWVQYKIIDASEQLGVIKFAAKKEGAYKRPGKEINNKFQEELDWLPVCRSVIQENLEVVASYREGKPGNFGFLISKVLSKPTMLGVDVNQLDLISEILERLLNEKIDIGSDSVEEVSDIADMADKIKNLGKIIEDSNPEPEASNPEPEASNPETEDSDPEINEKYKATLIKAGVSRESAKRMAEIKPPRTTQEGKIITKIELEEDKTNTNIEEFPKKEFEGKYKRENGKYSIFRRISDKKFGPDGYTIINKPRNTKSPQEVESEYWKAVEYYNTKFGTDLKWINKGKRGEASVCETSFGPGKTSNDGNRPTDAEIMLIANKKFSDQVLTPPLAVEVSLLLFIDNYKKRFAEAKTERALKKARKEALGKVDFLLKLLEVSNVIADRKKEISDRINAAKKEAEIDFKKRLAEIVKSKPQKIDSAKLILGHIISIGRIILKQE